VLGRAEVIYFAGGKDGVLDLVVGFGYHIVRKLNCLTGGDNDAG
jgi:hypothetical protein